MGERSLRKNSVKGKELLQITPETEQPVEFNFQQIVQMVVEGGCSVPRRDDYATLLSLLGPTLIRQIVPEPQHYSSELLRTLSEDQEAGEQSWGKTAQAKLFDPEGFLKQESIRDPLKKRLEDELMIMGFMHDRSWLTAVEILVLFPEDRQHILEILRPAEAVHVAFVESEPTRDPLYMDWQELVALRLVDPENSNLKNLIKQRWPKWIALLNGSIERALAEPGPVSKSQKFEVVLGIAAGLHILAAEKVWINDQGVPEITPSQKPVPAKPQLPERPLT